ncbi:hypothetical protein [Komagataeibacter sp. FNDCR2]|uniref:hypothetical protein n=1 Tax=Komagataeibacter sp. FNDCR2 TaxID=2878682 RepID=UPI001E42573B|nr:hypothetical protein [Komagataeibacter sp. FNDCR2]MCE2574193.1 hypothetical protein [Komagataeibacter sp. FNDCR2]
MTTINPTTPQAAYLSLQEAGNDRDMSSASGTASAPASGISDDIVTLSAEAMTELAQATDSTTDPQIAYYTRFFPTYADIDATALGLGAFDPGAMSLSSGLPPQEIALAARASMDIAYAALAAGDKSLDPDGRYAIVRNTLMAQLDRTALAAVSTNERGLFTRAEQNDARNLMNRQEELATGLMHEVSSPLSRPVDMHNGLTGLERITADIVFLDKAGSYEASTVAWAFSRAAAQVVYEGEMAARGEIPDNTLISEFSFILMLASSMTIAQKFVRYNNPSDRLQPGDEDEAAILNQLDDVLARTRKELGFQPDRARHICTQARRQAMRQTPQGAPVADLIRAFHAIAARQARKAGL